MNVPNALVSALLEIVYTVLNFYIWALVIGAVLSWLVAFNVINTHNRFVQAIGDFLYRITEPALRPIRRIIPIMGGLDLSPLVLIFIIMFLQSFIRHLMV
ncbi:MAG: YggT family protein [Alphaproteobacteria bacterium]|nr:YggT family protein [Alphaproteobacteria bacterium]